LGLFCPPLKLGRGRLLGGINLDLSVVASPELVSVGLGLRVAAVGTSRAVSTGFSTSASSCLSGEKSCLKEAVSVVLRVGRGVVLGLTLVEGRAGLGRAEGGVGGVGDPSLELELDTRVSTLTSRTSSGSSVVMIGRLLGRPPVFSVLDGSFLSVSALLTRLMRNWTGSSLAATSSFFSSSFLASSAGILLGDLSSGSFL